MYEGDISTLLAAAQLLTPKFFPKASEVKLKHTDNFSVLVFLLFIGEMPLKVGLSLDATFEQSQSHRLFNLIWPPFQIGRTLVNFGRLNQHNSNTIVTESNPAAVVLHSVCDA